jgi:molybdate transport system substrate-binding protein
MRRCPLVLAVTLLAPLAAGAEEIAVCAAASLTDALQEIVDAWEKSTGNTVLLNLGASNDLARQIRAGAPADVFLSADPVQMDGLERDGLVLPADRVDLLSNTLVVVVPARSTTKIQAPSDLAVATRLALADPQAVPAGVYARAWLASLGLWARVERQVIPTLNVRAALAAVESEQAEAGIVYKTDALVSKRVKVAYEVPRAAGPAIVYPLARVATSSKKASVSFVDHLQSPAARDVFTRFGFLVRGGQ